MCLCAKFDVAKALSFPEHNTLLESGLENDIGWGTNSPIAPNYKQKRLKRYKLERALDFRETSSREIPTETFTTSTVGYFSSAVAPLAGASGASMTDETLQVNIEGPEGARLGMSRLSWSRRQPSTVSTTQS